MAATKKWGPLKIGCVGVLAIAAMLLVWLTYMVVWAYTVEPGTGHPGTERFAAWMNENHPVPLDAAVGKSELQSARVLYESTISTFATDYPLGEQPEDWPRTLNYPYDFDSIKLSGLPPDLRFKTIDLMKRLDVAGLPSQLDIVARHDSFRSPIEILSDDNPEPSAMGSLTFIRQLNRYNVARMVISNEGDDQDEVIRAFDTSLALAKAASDEATLISRLSALATTKVVLEELRVILVESRFSVGYLELAERSIDRNVTWLPMAVIVEGLRAETADTVHQTFSDSENGDGRIILQVANEVLGGVDVPIGVLAQLPEGFYESKLSNVLGFMLPSKVETIDRANRFFDQFASYAATPHFQRRSQRSTIQLTGAEETQFPSLYFLNSVIHFAHDDAQIQTLVAGTRLMLAIERFRATRNALPKALDDLAPDFIAQVPIDPWTGTPFGYKRLSTPDEHGREYILYSYGSNLVDDGGVYNQHFQYFSESKTDRNSTSDFIFNTPRPVYAPPK